MAAAKKQSNRRGNAKATSGRKNTRKKQTRKQVKKQGVTSGFQTEIILLTILAASIILIISNLDMGVAGAESVVLFLVAGLIGIFMFRIMQSDEDKEIKARKKAERKARKQAKGVQ